MTEFERLVNETHPEATRATGIDVLQLNVGLRCNMNCAHCHQSCSPSREEMMDIQTMGAAISTAGIVRPSLVDITGGSPEYHPRIKELITALRDRDLQVQLRTNLTALSGPKLQGFAEFLASKQVRLLASFPALSAEEASATRGSDAHGKGLRTLKHLASIGYGSESDLKLDIAYNPPGTELLDSISEVETAFRETLTLREGIPFGSFVPIANMPIGRFRESLSVSGMLGAYNQDLRDAFNPETLPSLSCRTTLEVAWDGRLSDCDFNLAAGLSTAEGAPNHVSQFDQTALETRKIRFAEHCFACAAHCGSG